MDKKKIKQFDAAMTDIIAKIKEAQDLLSPPLTRKSMMLSVSSEYVNVTIFSGDDNATYWPSEGEGVEVALRGLGVK